MDRAKMEAGIRTFLEGIGERARGDDLERTPARVAAAWMDDLLAGYAVDPVAELSWVPAMEPKGPVLARDIRFVSVCVHHLLPFTGLAHVAYLPAERLAGLSKLGRVVDAHARRLQIQETLTGDIAATLERALAPAAALVVLEAEHTCMTLRGVRKEGSRLLTYAATGRWSEDAAARREILDLIAPGRRPLLSNA
ncbi:MAG TPA: GTP cyclohydrolase I [Candidatus Polarisedimenticolaceae bacterium]|nr:GTP cyclohydrolase I [Candidatus Polarisedimenticolaceae bacterium]